MTICRFFIAIIFITLLAGCADTEQLYNDISQSRVEAYNRWEHREKLREQSEFYLSGELTLEDSLKLALKNNKTLQRTAQEKEIASGGLLASQSEILPSVSANASYTRLDEVSSINVGAGSITMGDLDNYSTDLQVQQPIFEGGAIQARLTSAKLTSLLADQTVRAAVEDVIFQTTRVYYAVLLNQHLYQISADAVRVADVSLKDVKTKQQLGVASNFDVLRAEVEYSNFRAEEIRNKNAINVSRAALLKLLSVSQESDVNLADQLVYTPEKILFDDAVRIAYQNRPDLYQSQIAIGIQSENLKIAQSRYWPKVNAFYTYEYANPDPHSSSNIEWGNAWRTGVVATIPLFDGFSREGKIIQEKAKLKQSQIDMINAEEITLFELKSSVLSIQDAAEFVDSQRLNLQRAQEGLKLAEVGYREGINTLVEVIDAQSALTTARSLYYEAIYSHLVAKLALQKSMGTLATLKPALPVQDSFGNNIKTDSQSEAVKGEL